MFMLLALPMFFHTPAHAGAFVTVRTGDDVLLAFDPASASFIEIGPLGVDFDFGGLAWDPHTDTLYMAGGRANPGLFTVDVQTGAATLVGPHGLTDVFSLAFDPATSRLYAGQASRAVGLSVLDTTTGGATPIFNPPIGMSGATWYAGAQAILTNAIGISEFYLIDPVRQTTTLLGSGGVFLNDAGLAVDPNTGVIWTFDWSGFVLSFDPRSAFAATQVYGFGPSMDGAEYVPTVDMDLPVLEMISGSCPGPADFRVTNATPLERLVVLRGSLLDGILAPRGRCAGTRLPMANTRVLTQVQADANGEVIFSGTLPAQACRHGLLQVLDLNTCKLSNLRSL